MESIQIEISGDVLDEFRRQADANGVAVEDLAPVALRLVKWDQVRRVLSHQLEGAAALDEPDYEFLKSITPDYSEIPESELHLLPIDMAVNHDHYLYGAKKVRS